METTRWSDENIAAKCHSSRIKDYKSMICVKVFTNFNPISIITPEIRLNMDILPGFSKDGLDESMPLSYIVDRQAVVFLAKAFASDSFSFKLLIIIGII